MIIYYLLMTQNCVILYAEVAELADALDSKSSVLQDVPVRVRPSAPLILLASWGFTSWSLFSLWGFIGGLSGEKICAFVSFNTLKSRRWALFFWRWRALWHAGLHGSRAAYGAVPVEVQWFYNVIIEDVQQKSKNVCSIICVQNAVK